MWRRKQGRYLSPGLMVLGLLVLLSGAGGPAAAWPAAAWPPYQVADIRPGGSGSWPDNLTALGGLLFFVASDGAHGREPWVTDGTLTGTVQVRDVYTGTASSATPTEVAVVTGVAYFVADDGAHGREVWRSDGSTAGTWLLADIAPGAADADPSELTAAGGRLFFAADDGVTGSEPWVSDGNTTQRLRDVLPGGEGSIPMHITAVGDAVFFSATDPTNGRELWVSDGTSGGTAMVKDINPGFAASQPDSLAALGGLLYFSALDGSHGRELWASDGTSGGTYMVKDILPDPNWSSAPADLTAVGSTTLFFSADRTGYYDIELWKSDGTEAGTVLVADINPGGGADLQNLTAAEGRLFFAADDGTHGLEPWVSDGTTGGTLLLRDINPGGDGIPGYFVGWQDLVFFRADDGGSTGIELWQTDGTPGGTAPVADLRPGAGSAMPLYLTVAGGRLLFAASEGVTGQELWALLPAAPGPDLGLQKTVQPGTGLAPGSPVTYTLAFANGGTLTATEVVITDVLPLYLHLVAYQYGGVVLTPTGSVSYTWQVEDLRPGQAGSITITGVLSGGLPGGLTFTNTGYITTSGADPNLRNNMSQVAGTIVNVAPVAAADTSSTTSGVAVNIPVLANDYDLNGDGLNLDTVGAPRHGSAVGSGSLVTYTPGPGFYGTDTFTYTASDGLLRSPAALVSVSVQPAGPRWRIYLPLVGKDH